MGAASSYRDDNNRINFSEEEKSVNYIALRYTPSS